MNFKRAAIFAITFFILFILYYLFENPFGSRKKEEPLNLIPGFDKAKAASILIKSPEKGELNLKKEDKTWKVLSDNKTYVADTSPVDKLLDTVEKMKAETIASKNPKNFDSFEVTDGKGIEVKIDDASRKNLAHLYVGKSGPDIFSTYIRAKDSNRVILISGILKNVFEKELKDWRDKTIFKFDKENITEYKVEGDMSLHLKKDEKNIWQVVAPEAFPAKKETVQETFSKFASLKAVDFPEGDLSEFQLDKPARKIIAFLKDGNKKTLLVGKEKNTFQHFVKAKDRDTVFVIENYNLETLCPAVDKLREEEKTDNATK